jgi:large subunit ribosomal protein L5e
MVRKNKQKNLKKRSYFLRFQPKLRRRRECKTDYRARKLLIIQDKNKYNTPKYRFVVRITNKDIICQIISSKLIGDQVRCVAYSHELPRYGLEVGLTNWSASYATGLLCARRLLEQVGIDEIYKGNENSLGEFFLAERNETMNEDVSNPFRAYLDVGLRRTTTGARVFAAMKGASDGGLYIPHNGNGKQFPGWHKNETENNFNVEKCKHYIFGGHVADYMKKLQKEDIDKYRCHFSKYILKNITADNLEKIFEKLHISIRENPKPIAKKELNKTQTSKYVKNSKKSYSERQDHVLNKILAIKSKTSNSSLI